VDLECALGDSWPEQCIQRVHRLPSNAPSAWLSGIPARFSARDERVSSSRYEPVTSWTFPTGGVEREHPHELRRLAAFDPKVLTALSRIFAEAPLRETPIAPKDQGVSCSTTSVTVFATTVVDGG